MNNKYLKEAKYQETKEKVNQTGKTLLIIGIIIAIVGIGLAAYGFANFMSSEGETMMQFIGGGFLLVVGFAMAGFGANMLFIGHGREIAEFTTQQSMPIAKESIEKIAPAMGKVAKEISKNIKNIQSEDNDKDE